MSKKTAKKRHNVEVPLTTSRPELLANNSDNSFREMVHDSLAFAARLKAIRDGFAKYIDLTGIQYTILISIARLGTEKEVGVSEIASHLSLSGTFTTTEIRKLAISGLVHKEACTKDRRRVILKLTDKAKELLITLGEIQSEVNDVHFEPLSREDFERFSVLIKKLKNSTDRALVVLEHHLRLKTAQD